MNLRNGKRLVQKMIIPLKIYNGTPLSVSLEIQEQQLPINELNGTPLKGACPISNLHRCKPLKNSTNLLVTDRSASNNINDKIFETNYYIDDFKERHFCSTLYFILKPIQGWNDQKKIENEEFRKRNIMNVKKAFDYIEDNIDYINNSKRFDSFSLTIREKIISVNISIALMMKHINDKDSLKLVTDLSKTLMSTLSKLK